MSNVTRVAPLNTVILNLAANPAALGSNTLIAAPAGGGRIRVIALAMVSTGANTVTFLSAAAPISGAFDLAANGGMVLPFNEHGWMETSRSGALNVSLSAATKVAMQIVYQILPVGE